MPDSITESLKDAVRRTVSLVSSVSDTGAIEYDPTGGYARRRILSSVSNTIVTGIVVRSGCGTYDCAVKVGKFSVPCVVTGRTVSKAFGVTQGSVPVEGSFVLVVIPSGIFSVGYVIGVIPQKWGIVPNGIDEVKQPASHPQERWDPYNDNSSSYLPFKPGDKREDKILATSNRFTDIHPGESSDTNENNCGLNETMYSAELTGGASFVRVSRIDDEIRMRSTNFQKWTDPEFQWDFNDGGLLSVEGRNYSYQGEHAGTQGLQGPGYERPKDTDDKEPRPRIRFWKSFLGNVLSWFCVRARSKKYAEDEETLISVHASQGGNIMVRSTGGVSIEKYPRIPVPLRNRMPWDPQGDREVQTTHEAFKKFVIEDPHSRGIAESSKMAWEQRTMYRRFDELKKDFRVKNEPEIEAPGDDDKDPFGSQELDQKRYEKHKGGVFVGEDGSVIIRDAWGSEIVMLGGNVLINTPGNVITTANKDIVSIARRSAVVRGTEAAELSSEEGDVRIHANKLLEMAGGTDKDDAAPGGVLIESLAKAPSVNAPEKAGRDAKIGGIVIRSEKAPVSIGGSSTFVSGKDNIVVTSGDDGKKRSGSILVDGGTVILTGSGGVMSVCESSAVAVTEKSAYMVTTGSASVYGETGAVIVSGDKIPILWDSISDPLPDLKVFQDTFDALQDSAFVGSYSWKSLVENAVFSFRNSQQALTDSGIEPWKPNGEFTLYEPHWQIMLDTGDPVAGELKSVPYTPVVSEVHSTKCWPYKESVDSGRFVKYGSGNIEAGFSKPRESLQNSVGLKTENMSQFKV